MLLVITCRVAFSWLRLMTFLMVLLQTSITILFDENIKKYFSPKKNRVPLHTYASQINNEGCVSY